MPPAEPGLGPPGPAPVRLTVPETAPFQEGLGVEMKIFVIKMLGTGENAEDIPHTADEWLREPRPSPRWGSKGLGRGTRPSSGRRAPGGTALTVGTSGISPPSWKAHFRLCFSEVY